MWRIEHRTVRSRAVAGPPPGTRPDRRRRLVGRLRGAAALVCILSLSAMAGCRQDMHQAPRYNPLAESDFFADKRSARPLVEGTVARGFLRGDRRFYTGKEGNTFVPEVPMRVDKAVLLRGQNRFNVYCSPCHGRTGEGNGMIVQRGLKQPPSFYTERLRTQPDGYFYDVITNGFGAMQDYSAQVQPRDRWAIVAYLRTLQFSRNVNAADLSAEDRARLESAGRPAAAEGGAAHGGAGGHE
jgi:mono/diheme cytochrome c family protein